MKNFFLLSIAFLFTFASCGRKSKDNVSTYIIASETVDCYGVRPQKCMLLKKENAKEWEYFYGNIEGFNYVPGYEYVVELKEEIENNVAADDSSIKYVLVKEISKTPKKSENVPSENE